MSLRAIVGPTASGKTSAGIEVARRLGAEVVSTDSMLVYRGMDVGTAKPSPRERRAVPHHLIDVADPSEAFSVARYQELARAVLAEIGARGGTPLLVGGSGLYFRAVVDELSFPGTDPATRRQLEAEAALVGAGFLHRRLQGLDSAAARRIEPSNARRTIRALEVAAVTGRPFSSFARTWEVYRPDHVRVAGIEIDRDILTGRIEERVHRMLEQGFAAEVERLLQSGHGGFLTAGQAIGYAEMVGYLRAEMSLQEAVRSTVRRTRALARRQMAWFRRDPRIRWFRAGAGGGEEIVDHLAEYLAPTGEEEGRTA